MLLSVFFALSGRGMDLNPELLSAIDRLCVGLVVQCMFQCRVHNLNQGPQTAPLPMPLSPTPACPMVPKAW